MWGGGIYQPSDELTGGYDFYAACDELGIFAWSELIFSDNLYPINGFLLDSIDPEVRQNIRRINRHPSNAEWAAGNEVELIIDLGLTGEVEVPGDIAHHMDAVRLSRALVRPAACSFPLQFQTLFGGMLHDIVLSEQSSVSTVAGVFRSCVAHGGA